MPESLTLAQLNRAYLARQWLLEREAATPLKAIEHLVGLQAQEPKDPYVALWSRLRGFQPRQLESLLENRKAGRLGLMRSTLHLVSARDALALAPLTHRVLLRALRASRGKHLSEVSLRDAVDAGRALLELEPITYASLRSRLGEKWPGVDKQALAQLVRAHLSLVQIPPRGLWTRTGPPLLVQAESWFAKSRPAVLDESALVRRYLAAFGPASVADAQAWSGLTKLAAVFDGLRDELIEFRMPTGKLLYDLPKAARPEPDLPAPPRFLPIFDNVILGLRDRSRIIPAHMPDLDLRQNESVRFVLIDGFIGAAWKLEQRKNSGTAILRIVPFVALSPAQRAELRAEAESILAALWPDAGVEISIKEKGRKKGKTG